MIRSFSTILLAALLCAFLIGCTGDTKTKQAKEEQPKADSVQVEQAAGEHPQADSQKVEHPEGEHSKGEHPQSEHPQ